MIQLKKKFIIFLLISACMGCTTQKINTPFSSLPPCELVVLAEHEDPYYSLAEEIAAAEDAPLLPNLPEALAYQPTYLLWVVSPGFLSDEVMIEFGMTMKQKQPFAISTGIITGSTMEQARELWQRAGQVGNQTFVAVNAPNRSAHLDEGQILTVSAGQVTRNPLTREKFIQTLQTADYLTFTGHGGKGFLGLDKDIMIKADDIPTLDNIVIATVSCQTLRVWNDESIARKMIDQGAAAYSGFVFSPNEGYVIGEFNKLPFRYTWPDFPIGHVLQVQNRGTLLGFAHFPFHFLLGDPRIAFQSEPPYQWIEVHRQGEVRFLSFRDVPSGVIPIHIVDGSGYNFIEAPGITSASQGDFIYNSRLQMVNINQDKYVLLVHRGGDLTLKLRPTAPWYWYPIDFLLDSLDFTYIYTQQTGGDILSLVFSVIPLIWVTWQMYKKRIAWKKIRLTLIIGLGIAVLQGIYVMIRLPHVTITSKVVVFSPLSLLAAFLLGVLGTLIFIQARTWRGRLIGTVVITFTSWSVTIFEIAVITGFNMLAFVPRYGTSLYNQSLGFLSATAFIVTWVVIAIVFHLIMKGIDDGTTVNK
ncbi:MAG: hypothetical protein JW908_02530 [Anaerolineales bacterium]|nr:hypothetical protein [Anaerolineales bacterium]